MDAFLRALQGGQLPAGTRRELDARFGAQVTDDLIAAGLLVPGPRAADYPCPRLGSACPRDVIENVGDPAFPFVAVAPGPEHCCDAVRLTAEDVATWTTSRQRLVALVAELFRVRGPANLRDEVFPCAHRLGRAAWLGQERDVLLCTNLNGAAPTAFLLARKAQRQPTLVLAHARTRFTSPDVDAHFASGEVVVVFLEDELELIAGQVQRRQVLIAREPVATYGAPAFYQRMMKERAEAAEAKLQDAISRNLGLRDDVRDADILAASLRLLVHSLKATVGAAADMLRAGEPDEALALLESLRDA